MKRRLAEGEWQADGGGDDDDDGCVGTTRQRMHLPTD